MSSNNALLSFNLFDYHTRNINLILKYQTLFLAIIPTLPPDAASIFLTVPQSDISAGNIQNYKTNLEVLAQKTLSSLNLTPGDENYKGNPSLRGNSIRTGVFIDSWNVSNVYISWGFFEDQIINSQFGFGKNPEDVING